MTEPDNLSKKNQFTNICHAMLDSANMAILAVDIDGYIIYINNIARTLLDINKDIYSNTIHYSEIDPKAWSDFKEIMITGNPQIAIPVRAGLNSIVVNRSPIIMDGHILGVMSIFQQINKYENISDHLNVYKELLKQIEAIIESSYDGIYVTDGDANTIRINSAYERITGIKAPEVIGHNMSDLVRNGYFSESATLKVLSTKKRVTVSQTLKSGKKILVTGNPIFNETGKITMVVTNVRDMTDLTGLNRKLERSKEMTNAYKLRIQDIQRSFTEKNDLIAVSKSMLSIYELVERISPTDATIFLYGETGVGKDRIAEEVHNKSNRIHKGLIVKINCGAIPETLLESELFGYSKGAFTGANKEGKAGLFELADGGTLFLDEIEAMPMLLQSKLLRTLQNFEITRLGSTTPRKVDVRLISASNEDLKNMVKKGLFRNDLYYRLNVIPIFIPPLRERVEDIPSLVNFFLGYFNRKNSIKKTLSREAKDLLMKYSWPGNVREVRNLIERLVVVTKDHTIGVHHLPMDVCNNTITDQYNSNITLKKQLEEVEKTIIISSLKKYGNARRASPHLGIDHSTLTRKINRYKLHK